MDCFDALREYPPLTPPKPAGPSRIDARRPIMLAAAGAAGCAYFSYRFADGLIPFVLLAALGQQGTTTVLTHCGGVSKDWICPAKGTLLLIEPS